MKRLLIPLLAVLALPTAVSAESVWLLIKIKAPSSSTPSEGAALEKIEMKSMAQCEQEAEKLAIKWFFVNENPKHEKVRRTSANIALSCVKGK